MNTSIPLIARSLALACLFALPIEAHAQTDTPAPTAESVTPVEAVKPADQKESRGEIVSVGHNSTLPAGERADTVVSVFGSSTSAGEVNEEVVSVFGDSHVTGQVAGQVVAVFGNAYINSRIGGDAVAVFGNVELGPQAEIGGQVTVVGGALTRAPTAILHGGTDQVLSGIVSGTQWLRPWIKHCLLLGRPLAIAPGVGWAWGVALGFLTLYLLLALMFRGAVDRCVQTLELQPGKSVLTALLAVLISPVLMVLLAITVIGILFIPFLGIALLVAGFFGKTVILAALGKRITNLFGESPLAHTAVAVLIGGVLVLGLYLIPIVGFIVYKLLGILGLGVVIYTLIEASKASKRESAAPLEAAAGLPPAPPAETAPQPAVTDPNSLPRAGFWMRIGALFIDALLIGICLSFLDREHSVSLLLLAAYGAVMWKLKGTTIGGIVFGLKIVRLDGRPIDWPTAVVRALSCFLSLVVAGLGFIWIAFDDEKQSWHDKIAGTAVVRVPKGVSLL